MNISGNQTINEMDKLELNCTASLPARLTWKKITDAGDSQTIETQFAISRRSKITNKDVGSISQSTLVIASVVRSDSANYVCNAENVDVSSISTSVNHTVYVTGNSRIYALIIVNFSDNDYVHL